MADEKEKKVYGGKYGSKLINRWEGKDAGNNRHANPNDAGVPREKGKSLTKEYTFSNFIKGTHTIPATSFAEALRIAESMGFTRGDYKKR